MIVGFSPVKVGHRQTPPHEKPVRRTGFFVEKGFDVVLECTIRWKRLFFKNQQPISVGIWEKVARSLVRRPGCCAGRGRQKYP